jgi:hypothetical protein
LLQLIQLSKYEIKIQMDFNVIDSVINAVFFAQETVSGVVSDSSGPLPGVNVVVKGTKKGVSTGTDGKYSLNVLATATLEFSSLGFITQSKEV